jgi:chemotaxis signal transduction protein
VNTDHATRDVAAILRLRARALAQREVEERHDIEPLATFTSGGHALGVPLACVVRASELRHLTEVPQAPAWLLGLTAVEGHLVSLLDMATFLGLPTGGVTDVRGGLVVAWGKREIGLGAEQLLGIADVSQADLHPLPGGSGALQRVARGRGPHGTELLCVDVEALFDDPRLSGRKRS